MDNLDDLEYQLPLAHIVCHDSQNVIGDSELNAMPWRCSGELKYFQKLSMNKILIMGYNTYTSIIAHSSVVNKDHKLSTSPVLTGRISIVIADPNRTPYPADNIYNSQDALYLMRNDTLTSGITVFVPTLKKAVECAGMITSLITEAVANRQVGRDWYRGAGQPVAYIVGGGKVYEESLRYYNIVSIYETKLPIDVKVGKRAVKYNFNEKGYTLAHSEIQKHDIRLGNTVYRRSEIQFNYWKKKGSMFTKS